MYIINDIAYADEFNNNELKISDFKVITDLCMLITFSNGEKRIFDAQQLLKYPIYKKLEDFEIFKNAIVDNGILTWENGSIDIGVEAVYDHSYVYEQDIAV